MATQTPPPITIPTQTTTAVPCTLLFCGSTKFDLIGRKDVPKEVKQRGGSDIGDEVATPTVLHFQEMNTGTNAHPTKHKKFVGVYSGPVAAHYVLIDEDGVAHGVGRNDNGQLADASLLSQHHPVKLHLPDKYGAQKVIQASCGRCFTMLLTDRGQVFSCGSNTYGQLGINAQSKENFTKFRLVDCSEKVAWIAAGGEFGVLVTESGSVYSFGWPIYGQLGNGTNGERIGKNKQILYDNEVAPRRIPGFGSGEKEVKAVTAACGAHHSLVLDADRKVWSWGFGGYGRLGHKEQKDEFRPRKIDTFSKPMYQLIRITAGASCSYAVASNKLTYFWGQTKKTGEANMYPKPMYDLQGWNVHSIASGNTSTVVSADASVISWGPSPTFGELGYGENEKRSSTTPAKMTSMDGLTTLMVAEGAAFTLMLVRNKDDNDANLISKLPSMEIAVPKAIKLPKVKLATGNLDEDEDENEAALNEQIELEEAVAAAKKRKAGTQATKGKPKKK